MAAHRALRRLQLAWLAVSSADYAIALGLALVVFADSGAIGVGVMAAVRTGPALFVGPLLAVALDRMPRRYVVATGLAVRVVAVSAMVVLVGSGAGPWLYVWAAVDTAAASLFWPGVAALIPGVARTSGEMATANAAMSVVESVGTLVGPLAAGVFMSLGVRSALFAGVAVGLAVAAVLVATVHTVTDEPVAHRSSIMADVRLGLRRVVERRGPRTVIAAWTGESVVLGALDVFVVVLAIEVLGAGESGAGFLTAAGGAGGVLGAILMVEATRVRKVGRAFGTGIVTMGVVLVAVAWLSATPAVVAGLFVIGVATARVDVAGQTALQRVVDDELLGRALGLFESLYWVALGLGGLVAGFVVDRFGIRVAMAVAGGSLIVSWFMARPTLTSMDTRLETPAHAVAVLQSNEVLGFLPIPALEHLARLSDVVERQAGDLVIREGDRDDALYVVADGQLEVRHEGERLARVSRGSIVGEIAAFRHVARTADVRAVDSVRLLRLPGADVVGVLAGHAVAGRTMGSMIVGRLARTGHGRRAAH